MVDRIGVTRPIVVSEEILSHSQVYMYLHSDFVTNKKQQLNNGKF